MPYKQGVTGSSPVVSTKTTEGFPLGFLLPSTALCAALRRAPFGRSRDKSLLTLAQTAPAASAPPLCVHAPPFGSVRLHPPSTRPIFFPRFALAVPSLRSLRVQLFPPKQPRGFLSVFCCPQQPSARHCAARLSADPVTSHCSRSRKPPPPPPRLLFAFTLRRSATFVCIPLPHAPLSSPFCSRCSVAPLLTSPVVSTKNPLNSDFFFAREMPVLGFDHKIRAKWRQCCVGKRCRNSEYPSSKRDFRHGTHLPESQKSKKQPFRRTVVSW